MNTDSYIQWVKLLDHLNIGAMIIDTSRRIRLFNTSAQILLGLEKQEIQDNDCQEIFCGIPCFTDCPLVEHESLDIREMDVEFMDETHEKHRVKRIGAPLYGEDGRLAGCVSLLQDHTPYSELINRIHYEEKSLKIILDSLKMGIFTINRNGLVTFFNTAAEKMSGYSRMKLLGRNCRMLFVTGRQQDRDPFQVSLDSGEPSTGIKEVLLSEQGETIPVSTDFFPLANSQGRIIGGLAALQDMTLACQLDQAISNKYRFHNMIARDPAMEKIIEIVKVVAGTESTVLIEGATGTGKDLLAKIIHQASNRAGGPFVKINCAAIPDNLLESEFFGYIRGAFTGAEKDKPGRFCEADTGTIFLDEIGDLPLSLQGKLLRVIEDREFYPLGSRKTKKVDVRILSATNRPLEDLVEEKLFRQDLFYRLNVLRIELPPLCQRQGDLPLLIRHILRKHSGILKRQVPEIHMDAMNILLNYNYPGNVRELENILEHAIIICRGDEIRTDHLPVFIQARKSRNPLESLAGPHDISCYPEKKRILDALTIYNGHRGKTARSLSMDRTTLWRKMKRYSIFPHRQDTGKDTQRVLH
ncbi:MAG: sigma 54-interacting transcriptional regulator [Pseudomonadota bacterium]